MGRQVRLRLATLLPFTAGVFLGTLLALFLLLAVRSIDEEEVTPYREDESTGVVVMPSTPRDSPPKKTRDYSADNVRHRELVHFSVVVPRAQLRTRGLAVHYTWGSDLGSHVSYYLYPPGSDEDVAFAYKKRMPLVTLGHSTNPRGKRHFNGVIRSLLDVCERELGRYQWYARIADSTYVRTTELERVLSTLNSSEPRFIGHRVLPEGREREELGLREGEGYCGEMGYVMSEATLRLVCPRLEWCWGNARSENEDVEVARCVRMAAGINCTSSREVRLTKCSVICL